MFLKRLATVGAVIALAVGITTTSAEAVPHNSSFQNRSKPAWRCLDFRADYGPYVFGCNHTTYQQWYWNDELEFKALRQKATGLCLVSRNARPVMKPCNAQDDAALWLFMDESSSAVLLKNAVSHLCLARMSDDRVNTTKCTGGPSQRWTVWDNV
ncbi:hypothetical protein GTW43_28200 [Streptomyces sp. SID5785]|uniref:RICIN domain-containing protein n=1 Tax=Streptomyces sp. SID5785 TaxID=2690309 RepID=UPI001360F5A8|nr:RICIN domain-containing protein [Streptomyces sp. SID5785]MZD08928.1 hypothetical protein [Streptomyces sp. SID5785]